MKKISLLIIVILLVTSCASKKNIIYFQDADEHSIEEIQFVSPNIQVNDILNITVGAQVPETAIPYNLPSSSGGGAINLDVLRLQGYLVTDDGTIDFPFLGSLVVAGKTIEQLEDIIEKLLEEGGHLIRPVVNARVLNSKVTVLGEVRIPGTFNFIEQAITLPQALGYAGDLTINGERRDVLVIREENGMRTINHIDMTSTNWFTSPFYYIKPNDVIVVNPNEPKVKSAGYIGNAGTILGIASLILTSVVLITN